LNRLIMCWDCNWVGCVGIAIKWGL
jgi:hypothetical protein